jgi:hypothetical protein
MRQIQLIGLLLMALAAHAQTNNGRGDVVLFDNGSIINSPGTGMGGADESVLQNVSLGMITFGTGHQSSANLRVADDFTVSGDDWAITTIDLLAYQTDIPAPSITAVNLRIWDGVPAAMGSTVVFGDTTTNVLSSTSAANILRVDENTTGMDDQRPITIASVAINTTLPAGTYWLDWQVDGTGGSGPFVPHITITGQDTTGNAVQSTDNGSSYANLVDLGTFTAQGLPFVINGNVQGSAPVAIPLNNPLALLLLIGLITWVTVVRTKTDKTV